MYSVLPTSNHPPYRIKAAILVGLAAMLAIHVALFFSWRAEILNGYADFTSFYTGGKCLQEGLRLQLYDLETQFRLQREFAPNVAIRHGPLAFNHPAFEALIFLPLAFLSYTTAYWTWVAVNLLLLVGVSVLVGHDLAQLRNISRALPVLALLGFFPIFVAVIQGQDSILLLFLFVLAFLNLRNRRDFIAGACLGLGMFKFQLVIPFLLIYVFGRRWKMLAGFITSSLIVTILSAAVVGWHGLVRYPHYLLGLSHELGRRGMDPYAMPNLRGFVIMAMGTGPHATALIALFTLVLLVFAIRICSLRRQRLFFELCFALSLSVSLMVSYHLMPHDLSLLILPLLTIGEYLLAGELQGPLRVLCVASTILLFFSPLYLLLWLRFNRGSLMFVLVLQFALTISLVILQRDQETIVGGGY